MTYYLEISTDYGKNYTNLQGSDEHKIHNSYSDGWEWDSWGGVMQRRW